MTNNTNNDRKLAEVGDHISARASLYHVLLVGVVKRFARLNPTTGATYCSVCGGGIGSHLSRCWLKPLADAVMADNATIRALLADVNPPEVDA